MPSADRFAALQGTKDTNALRKCRWSLAVKPVSNSSKFRLAQVQLEHNEVYCVGSQVKRDEAKRMKKDNAYWQDKIILTVCSCQIAGCQL